jgi:LysM repeat protein
LSYEDFNTYAYNPIFAQQTPPCPGGTLYHIQPGDTFNVLAARFGVTAEAIIAANPGVNPRNLQIGQQVCIPGQPDCHYYQIRPGDTFFYLSQLFGITSATLQAANPGVDPNRLQVGQTICLPWGPICKNFRTCTLFLSPVQQSAPNSAGVFLYRRNPGGEVQLLVTTVNLPNPTNLGAGDYTASLSWERTSFDLPLNPIPGTPGAWFGTTIQPSDLPGQFFSQGDVTVFPGPVIGGVMGSCR